MNRIILIISIIVASCWHVAAQKIENVDFKVRDNIVTVRYDLLDCPDNYVYDVRLKFKTENGDFIYPKAPSGDLKEVSQGTGKEITWNVLSENQEIRGNVSAIVEIEDRHYIRPRREKVAHGKIQGGPSNAFLSMLLPGLGDYFVNKYAPDNSSSHVSSRYSTSTQNKYASKKGGYWYVVPVTYYLCLYGAYAEYAKYKQSYSDYHSATIQTYMDQYYDQANTHYQNSQIYLGVAASAWLIDVIHVAVKGSKNRKRQLNGLSVIEPKTNYYFVSTGKDFRFGLTYKF